jgi:hypothetical protein
MLITVQNTRGELTRLLDEVLQQLFYKLEITSFNQPMLLIIYYKILIYYNIFASLVNEVWRALNFNNHMHAIRPRWLNSILYGESDLSLCCTKCITPFKL